MNKIQATEAVYSGERVHCTKIEWERDVKNSLEDYILRCRDVGDDTRADFTSEEIKRLDQEFKFA